MSDAEPDAHKPNSSDDVSVEEQASLAQLPDTFLQLLVRAAMDDREPLMDITLNVGGLLVTGELVSARAYFEGIAQEAESSSGSGATLMAELMRRWAREVYATPANEDDRPRHYIHLKNSAFVLPGQAPIPVNRGVYWRGRLGAIDGFCLGRLSATP